MKCLKEALLFSFITYSLTALPLQAKMEAKTETKAAASDTKEDPNLSTLSGNAEAEQTVKIGNLAFPPSQQPSPLVSFGQNILDKKQKQVQLLFNEFKGEDQYAIIAMPSLLYAFTESFSLFLQAPLNIRSRQRNHHASGPGDLIVQLEYAFYTKAYHTYYDQATLVTNVTIPTGSNRKNPSTGIGSNSFFIGGTYSRMEVDWFYFISSGGVFTGCSHRTQYGDQFLYQGGFGRRIANTKEWLFAWMMEFDGIYSWRDHIRGITDPNSGGNVIYFTPSLFISSIESLFVQLGIGFPIKQHLFGTQDANDYTLDLNLGWTF